MSEVMSFFANCTCKAIQVEMQGEPKVAGTCHCEDCRQLLNVPYHQVNAWEKQNVKILEGKDSLKAFKHPDLNMQKYFCDHCGDVVFNSNAMDWRVFSQMFVARSYDGNLPNELKSKMHFLYSTRIVDIEDQLPKKG